jgi:formamidopyrimidine-DNA glycosylase
MPELPEVQTIVNDLKAAGIIGLTISGAKVFWRPSIGDISPTSFHRHVKNRTVASVWRRGKYIVFDFRSGGHLLLHLRMSGRLHLVSSHTQRSKHEHVILSFGDGKDLRFYDPRKFGRLYVTDDTNTILGRLGPEPLGRAFTARSLYANLSLRKRAIKPLLLDQTFIAGLGNIYVDEALWEAKIHPCRIAASLSWPETKRLHEAIGKVLQRGLKNRGTTLGTGEANFSSIVRQQGRNQEHLNVFRRSHSPCPRCQTVIERMIVGQRGTHICPACQK